LGRRGLALYTGGMLLRAYPNSARLRRGYARNEDTARVTAVRVALLRAACSAAL